MLGEVKIILTEGPFCYANECSVGCVDALDVGRAWKRSCCSWCLNRPGDSQPAEAASPVDFGLHFALIVTLLLALMPSRLSLAHRRTAMYRMRSSRLERVPFR